METVTKYWKVQIENLPLLPAYFLEISYCFGLEQNNQRIRSTQSEAEFWQIKDEYNSKMTENASVLERKANLN